MTDAPLAVSADLTSALVPLLLFGGLYARRAHTLAGGRHAVPRWRQACFYGGFVLVGAALTALGGASEELLYVHMIEHLLLGDIAALLIVLGLTAPMLAPILRIRFFDRLRLLTQPAIAFPLWAIDMYVWHLPVFYEAALRHPGVHARLREGDPAYLDAVVKEVLRVRPALTIAPRLLLEPVRIAGRTLPAGVQVAACLWLALRRDDLWPQAAAFRPERWLEGPPPNPMSWIPFGGGVRRCAGAPFAEMEMREVLRAAAELRIRPVRAEPERARRSMLVITPHRGGEVLVG